MVSENIIVRASNPGQFESETDTIWNKDCTTGAIYHSGNVAINTDKATEALTVNGNIQLTGQVLQPSDLRLKNILCQLNPETQLENVNKLKIYKYQYKPEFLEQLPDDSPTGTLSN